MPDATRFIGGVDLSTWADFQELYVQYVAPVGMESTYNSVSSIP